MKYVCVCVGKERGQKKEYLREEYQTTMEEEQGEGGVGRNSDRNRDTR